MKYLESRGTEIVYRFSQSNHQLTETPPRLREDLYRPAGFPVLNFEALRRTHKAEKRADLGRMLGSPNSEDWVTWNFFQLLGMVPESVWWPALLDLADSPWLDRLDTPRVQLWRTASSPRDYEAASRERLRRDASAAVRARSRHPSPVEGPSEIDIVLEGRSYLVFVEAKLGSDVSLRTTHDPRRDQIARNIDCLIGECGNRRPVFWMFARDRSPARAYVQLMGAYASEGRLHQALPHHGPAVVEPVASGLRILCWAELLPLLGDVSLPSEARSVRAELERRVRPREER